MEQRNYGQGYGQAVPQQKMQSNGIPLGWDAEVEEKQFILLPEGEYPFRVIGVDKEAHNGTDKMPACNVANIHIVINYNGEEVQIDKKLFLISTNGQLFDFFRAIGAQTLSDGRIKMNWNNVLNAEGRAIISHRKYNGNDYNQIKRFVEPASQETSSQQPWQQGGKW